jgi:hypothetical protein
MLDQRPKTAPAKRQTAAQPEGGRLTIDAVALSPAGALQGPMILCSRSLCSWCPLKKRMVKNEIKSCSNRFILVSKSLPIHADETLFFATVTWRINIPQHTANEESLRRSRSTIDRQ